MFGFAQSTWHFYHALPSTEDKSEQDEKLGTHPYASSRSQIAVIAAVSSLVLLFLGAGAVIGWHMGNPTAIASSSSSFANNTCKSSSLPREWRSLAIEEKLEYIESVKCLRDRPSALGLNHMLFDDFPWIHQHVGEYCTSLLTTSFLRFQ